MKKIYELVLFILDSPCFSLQRSGHGINSPCEVLTSGFKLLFLVMKSTFDIGPCGRNIHLSSSNLVFFLLQSRFCFFKCTLKLIFLNLFVLLHYIQNSNPLEGAIHIHRDALYVVYLQPSSLFVQFMDRAPTFPKLIHQIFNLIRKILILPRY